MALLYSAAAALGIRKTLDAHVQKNTSTWFALASLVAVATSLHSVATGAVNALGWSRVALYGFFTLAWAGVAIRKT